MVCTRLNSEDSREQCCVDSSRDLKTLAVRHILLILGSFVRIPMAISAAVALWWDSRKWLQYRYLVKSIKGSAVTMLLIIFLINIQRNVFVSELYFKL